MKFKEVAYSIYNTYMWITDVYFDLFLFWELQFTKTGVGALTHTLVQYSKIKVIQPDCSIDLPIKDLKCQTCTLRNLIEE